LRPGEYRVGIDPSGPGAVVVTETRDLLREGLIRQETTEADILQDVTRFRYEEKIQSPVRPSDEIDFCLRCGHPTHDSKRALCGFLEPQGVIACHCTGQPVAQAPITGDDVRRAMDGLREQHGTEPYVDPDQDFNDLQAYLEGGTAEAQAAAKRLDQRAVDNGQISPGLYRETWGELPRPSLLAHKIWCPRHRDHSFHECPRWGDE
jgi:hypothetical protein